MVDSDKPVETLSKTTKSILMNHIHKRRIYYVIFFVCGLALATGFILYALKQNLNVFLTPQQLARQSLPADYHFRLGGVVKTGSIVRDAKGLGVEFIVTDFKQETRVRYVGVLPDLFHEGKGVITEGNLNKEGLFTATEVLAKHDENYMPKNVYENLRKNAA